MDLRHEHAPILDAGDPGLGMATLPVVQIHAQAPGVLS